MRIKLILSIICLSALAWAVPSQISFQGVLKDSTTGAPITGSREITFTIFGSPAGPGHSWTETRTVSIEAGLYNVQLNAPASAFDGTTKYLGISIGGTELLPRVMMVSVPYAYRADQATYADYSGSSGGIPNAVFFTPNTAQTTSAANAVWISSSASDTAFNGLSILSIEATGANMLGARIDANNSNGYGLYVKAKKLAAYIENGAMGVMLGASQLPARFNIAVQAVNNGSSGGIGTRYVDGTDIMNIGGGFSASGSESEIGIGLTADITGGNQYGYAARFVGGAGVVLPDSTGELAGQAANLGPGTLEGTVRYDSTTHDFFGWTGTTGDGGKGWVKLNN